MSAEHVTRSGGALTRWSAWMPYVVAVLLALSRPSAASPPAGARSVSDMVRRALPSVVSITTRQIETNQFNQAVPTRGLGSGFIVDRRGYILTNNHVVEGAEEIKVTLTAPWSSSAVL